MLSFDTRNKIRMALPPVLPDIVLGFLNNAVKQEKYELYRDCKKMMVMSLFTDDMIAFLEDSEESFKSLQVC